LAVVGCSILSLQQGDWQDPQPDSTDFAGWDFRAATNFSFDPNVRSPPKDYPVNNSESDILPLMFNAAGGSTIHWTTASPTRTGGCGRWGRMRSWPPPCSGAAAGI
jgi:hypothetical protein